MTGCSQLRGSYTGLKQYLDFYPWMVWMCNEQLLLSCRVVFAAMICRLPATA